MYQVRHISNRFYTLIKQTFLVTFIYLYSYVCHILFRGLCMWCSVDMGHQGPVQRRFQMREKVEYLYMTILFTSSSPSPCNKVKTL
jgi:hypothetical protein